ncbi:MAG: right-handed parallel beta-helix repeat-containing protein [Planctomycetia bacterium]|nr:right-handed parallel beta-helix repeat-containing protein [Planctomycetia bacterium]
MRLASCLAILLLVGGSQPTPGADLFVDNALGDDVRDGRTSMTAGRFSGPVHSLTRGLALAQPGDRIVMSNTGEPYRESVTLFGGRNSGRDSRPFVIEGNGATLDGSLPVPPKAWEHFAGEVFRFRPERLAFGQLFLDGRPAVRRYHAANSGRLPQLDPREWCLAGGWMYFRVEPDQLPVQYPLSYAALTVGITLYEVHDAVVQDLVVQGFQLDGVNAHDSARDCALVGLVARGNGRAGIAVGGASSVRLESCLVGDNGDAQVLTDGVSVTSIEDCKLLANTAPPIVRRAGRIFVDGRAFTTEEAAK